MNHIQIYDNALSKDTCNNIIAYFNDHPNISEASTVFGIRKDVKNGKNLTVLFKDCSKFMYDLLGSDIIPTLNIGIEKYKKSFPFLEEITYWEMDHTFNIQKFDGKEEGYFKRHCENDGTVNLSQDYLHRRMLVWMIYLNDAKSGTRFYYPRRDVKAKQGRLVIWPADWTHPHSGITPNRGEKYLMTGWYSYRKWE